MRSGDECNWTEHGFSRRFFRLRLWRHQPWTGSGEQCYRVVARAEWTYFYRRNSEWTGHQRTDHLERWNFGGCGRIFILGDIQSAGRRLIHQCLNRSVQHS